MATAEVAVRITATPALSVRQEALRAAMALVDDIAPRTNSRGYTDGTLAPEKRIAEVLRVAEWLLAGRAEVPSGHTCADCGGTYGDIVHIEGAKWRHAYGNCDTGGESY